jgi:hypothetical protein
MQPNAILALVTLMLNTTAMQHDVVTHSLLIVNQTPYSFDALSATIDFAALKEGDPGAKRLSIDLRGMNVMYSGQARVIPINPQIACILDLDALTPTGLRFSSRIDVCAGPAVWIIRVPNTPV